MKRSFCTAFGVGLLLAGATHANVVVPNYAASSEADLSFFLTTTTTAGRTYQMTIAASELTGLIGQPIEAMQWRLNGGVASWPPVDANYAFWDVFIGPGVDPATMSNTFANNFSGAATQVRSGPLTFAAGSFPGGSTPNDFGPALTFSVPYVYTGGDLTIEMRFSQQTGATSQANLDGVNASGGPGNGWGVNFAARWTGNAAGTTGTNGNFLVTRLIVPAPSSLALLGLSMGLAMRRRPRQL